MCASELEPAGAEHDAGAGQGGANYMNSQLIRMEAEVNGYVEGSRWT